MTTLKPATIIGATLYKMDGIYWIFQVKRKRSAWNNKLGCCKHDYVVYNRLTNKSINFTLDFEDALFDKKMQRTINKCMKILSK